MHQLKIRRNTTLQRERERKLPTIEKKEFFSDFSRFSEYFQNDNQIQEFTRQ